MILRLSAKHLQMKKSSGRSIRQMTIRAQKVISGKGNDEMNARMGFALEKQSLGQKSLNLFIERGSHDELYAMDGAYRKLCDMQQQK